MSYYKLFYLSAVVWIISCVVPVLPGSGEVRAYNSHPKHDTASVVTEAIGGTQSQESAESLPKHVQISSLIKLQILLDRAGFSSGEIDGTAGTNVRKAISAFQDAHGLPLAGRSDEATLQALASEELSEPLVSYTISDKDAAGPFVESIPKDVMEQAKLPSMGYTSIMEALGEKFHCTSALLKKLNPESQFQAGDTILAPNLFNLPDDAQSQYSSSAKVRNKNSGSIGTRSPGATIIVTERTSDVVLKDTNDKIIFYAPATVGSEHDRLPIGGWKVTVIHRNPVFSYNPDLFWDAKPENSKVNIAPGPNNPVGTVWIGLNAPSYGLHGTPDPSKIGHAESHGCIRMTNWDALRLASLIAPGTKVVFQ
jgi:lipoprotein-anchoring transpeptidase ErfK/SrfK